MKRLSIFGIVATIIYAVFLVYLTRKNWDEFARLNPNEWGDFLAGTLGPLAIFWLILGYFQQGKELNNSVETLKLQAKELKNSVEQQRELVVVTREAIQAEKEIFMNSEARRKQSIKPRFEPTASGGSSSGNIYKYNYRFVNHGGAASNVTISISPDPFAIEGPKEWSYIKKSAMIEGKIRLLEEGIDYNKTWDLTLRFQDPDGDSHEQFFTCRVPQDGKGTRLKFD